MESLTLEKKMGSPGRDGRDPLEWVKIKLEEWANSSDSEDSVIQVMNEDERDHFRRGHPPFLDEVKIEEEPLTKDIPETINLVMEDEIEEASSKNNCGSVHPAKNDAREELPAKGHQGSIDLVVAEDEEETSSMNCWVSVGSVKIKVEEVSSVKDHQGCDDRVLVEGETSTNNLLNCTDTVKDEPGEELPINSSLHVEQNESNKLPSSDCIQVEEVSSVKDHQGCDDPVLVEGETSTNSLLNCTDTVKDEPREELPVNSSLHVEQNESNKLPSSDCIQVEEVSSVKGHQGCDDLVLVEGETSTNNLLNCTDTVKDEPGEKLPVNSSLHVEQNESNKLPSSDCIQVEEVSSVKGHQGCDDLVLVEGETSTNNLLNCTDTVKDEPGEKLPVNSSLHVEQNESNKLPSSDCIQVEEVFSVKDHQGCDDLVLVEGETLTNNFLNCTDTVKDEPGEELPVNSSLHVEQNESNKLPSSDCIQVEEVFSVKDHQGCDDLVLVEGETSTNNLLNCTDTVKDEPGEELPVNSSLHVEQNESNKLPSSDCMGSTRTVSSSEGNGFDTEPQDYTMRRTFEDTEVEEPDTQDPEESAEELHNKRPTAETGVIAKVKNLPRNFRRRKAQRRKRNASEDGQGPSSKLVKKLEKPQENELAIESTECGESAQDPSYCAKHQSSRMKPEKGTDGEKSFNEHSRHMKLRSRQSDQKSYACTGCGKCFSSQPSLAKHKKYYIGKRHYKCTECEKSFAWKSVLRRHQKIHTGEKPFECSECGKHFRDASTLKGHQRSHTGEKPYQCTKCEKTYTLSSDLTNHLRTHTGEKPYVCTECTKSFTRSSDLRRHQRIHTGEKPHKCSECFKSFNQAANLRQHLRSHTGEKPYQCTECERRFTQKADLFIHQKIHIEKPYRCPECKRSFSSSSALLHHQIGHKEEKPYQCDKCAKQFELPSQLKQHQRTHTGERPYLCLQCEKSFIHGSHLMRHLRIHTGEKRFKCTECKKSFGQSSHLLKHQKLHAGEIPNQCKECGKIFLNSAGLTRHQRIHTGVKPYVCNECSKQFTQASHLRRHKGCHVKEGRLVVGDCNTGEGEFS